LVVTDTIPPFRLDVNAPRDKIDTVRAAPLFAAAIHRLHDRQTLTDLLAF
jgi:ribose-phosphate pyrophosphokinase